MTQRIRGKANATQSLHVDYGDNKTGFMVEAELMRRKKAVENPNFANKINSPGEKMLANAEINNQALYKDIVEKANKFEKNFNGQKVENKQKMKGKKCHQIKLFEKIWKAIT